MSQMKSLMRYAQIAANLGDRNRRGGRYFLAAVLMAACLDGCGWQPLYGRPSPNPASGGVGAALAQIAVDPVESKSNIGPLEGNRSLVYDSHAAQTLQNALLSSLNPYGRPSQPIYHLVTSLQEQTQGSASLSNGQATRNDVNMRAEYKLIDEKGKEVLADEAKTVTSFDVLYQPYNDVAARRDALERGAREIAELMEARLAVFIKNPPPAKP